LREFEHEIVQHDGQVVVISFARPDHVRRFAEHLGHPFLWLADPEEPGTETQGLGAVAPPRVIWEHLRFASRGRVWHPEELDIAQIRIDSNILAALLDRLAGAGRILREGAGEVIGSAGLSVVPGRHEIELEARRFWTWCAYDSWFPLVARPFTVDLGFDPDSQDFVAERAHQVTDLLLNGVLATG